MAKNKIEKLNRCQHEIYKKYSEELEKAISSSDGDAPKQLKRNYTAIIAGYSRFERTRNNFKAAVQILNKVPRSYPDFYRILAEEAMIYQFKPGKNAYFDLEKAVHAFNQAYKALEDSDDTYNVKSKKSILMPLANTLVQLKRYNEAAVVCNRILSIDGREQRAIDLKQRIEGIAS